MTEIKRKIYRELLEEAEGFDFTAAPAKKQPVLYVCDEGWAPPTDILETAREIFVIMEIAGIRPREVDIRYSGGNLSITGVREDVTGLVSGEITYFHKKEIDAGRFRVRVKITRRIRSAHIKAQYKKGFLIVRLPKEETSSDSADIEVEVT